MSEYTIQQGIQAAIQAMSEFDNADVTINDWTVLDQPNEGAPYVIIESSDDFASTQDTVTPETTWFIPVTLYEYFTEWSTALNNLRTRRQAIIDKINSGNQRSAGGLAGTSVRSVRSGGPIGYVYDRYIAEDQVADAMPIFLSQQIIFEVLEF